MSRSGHRWVEGYSYTKSKCASDTGAKYAWKPSCHVWQNLWATPNLGFSRLLFLGGLCMFEVMQLWSLLHPWITASVYSMRPYPLSRVLKLWHVMPYSVFFLLFVENDALARARRAHVNRREMDGYVVIRTIRVFQHVPWIWVAWVCRMFQTSIHQSSCDVWNLRFCCRPSFFAPFCVFVGTLFLSEIVCLDGGFQQTISYQLTENEKKLRHNHDDDIALYFVS